MPSPNKKVLHAYLTPEEYEQIKIMTDQARLSISTFVKRVCLGQTVKTRTVQGAMLALLKAKTHGVLLMANAIMTHIVTFSAG